MRSRFRYLSLLLVASVLLAACGTKAKPSAPAPTPTPAAPAAPAVEKPVMGGTLTVAYTTTSPHIDINLVNQNNVSDTGFYFYESLFYRNAKGQVEGLLVKESSISADGKVHTWKLQPDVKFHDGTAFDAEAVKFNLERKITKKLPTWDLVPWDKIEVVDPLTVKVTLTRPSPGMYGVLTQGTWMMYSPTFVKGTDDNGLKLKAVGTGPFTVTEFKPNESLTLSKNPNYWQKGLPYLDKVVFKVVNDANTRATMVEAGDVDIAQNLPIPAIEKIKTNNKFTVLEELGSNQYYMAMNNKKFPLDDVKVRQAINHAVDKEGIIKAVFLGKYAQVAKAVYTNPTIDGYSEAGVYAYDPAKAKQILDAAGWKAGADGVRVKDGKRLSITLTTRKGGVPGDYEIAELTQGMLKEVGVEVKLTVLESAAFVPAVTQPADKATYDIVNLNVGTFTGDAEYTMLTFYHTKSAAPVYYNRAHFSNAEVDKLIDQSLTAPTKAARNEIYKQVNKLVFDQAPIVQLFDSKATLAMSNKLRGVYFENAQNMFPARFAWKAN